MMRLKLEAGASGALQILCLGCHSDDIEIGCGGTILKLAEEHPGCVFHWVVFSAIGVARGGGATCGRSVRRPVPPEGSTPEDVSRTALCRLWVRK